MPGYPDVELLIDRLELEPHPEGGYFRETWRSDLVVPADALTPDHGGPRNAGTSILYLLPAGEVSARHRVVSDELWLFQHGDPLDLTIESPDGAASETFAVGATPECTFQKLVPAHHWQSAESQGGTAGYTLVACIVVPGFDFDDFEMSE